MRRATQIQGNSDRFETAPVCKGITKNVERPTIDINDLLDGFMKNIGQFSFDLAEHQDKNQGYPQ
ncbi:MAG: hypothetical protein A2X84_04725 [Desulfuromonadaceae bacterium GWC2_58_13]|nr:MAG: hypothetical protein A2X84_04725 [Desulfuromonadaceae bacterium GWC2_58_13]